MRTPTFEEFNAFLLRHRCKRRFIKNIDTLYPKTEVSLKDFYLATSHDTPFERAFVWSYSPEHHPYWSNIDDKWIKYKTKKQ